ncbi:MAG: paraslipin [bacterium]|nr:MAG: paraslipin [bacterium]
MFWFAVSVLAFLYVFVKMVIVVPERNTCIKERMGRFEKILSPGWHFLYPFIDRVAYVQEMREQVLDIPPQGCITRDNIQVEVDGLVYLKVVDAHKASYGIENYRRASVNMAQTTMRAEIGKISLDKTFTERESINESIVKEIDKASNPWGIKMMRYEIKNITPSDKIIDTMEKQMEAERQKRAEILLATADKEARICMSEGERQEAINLSEGEKVKRINESQGRAKEISLVAQATASGIKRIAEAIQKPGGNKAVKMQIVEQFITELGNILQSSKVSVVPGQLANIKGFFEGIGEVSRQMGGKKTE